ncbi:hypothetical protein [Sediminicola sp. 1XM1-17]|uniref:hypothetical protein n=1 Tax=Sediminicola sp. 1XM1-17 TaxID=3127702 RepID=UPI0030788BE6
MEKAIDRTNGHCERNEVEHGNLMNGTCNGQIASAKRPRNDGEKRKRQIKLSLPI